MEVYIDSIKEIAAVMSNFLFFGVNRNYRNSIRSLSHSAGGSPQYPRVEAECSLTSENFTPHPNRPISGYQDLYDEDDSLPKVLYHTVEEEIALAPACWLWDYLRYK